MDDPTSFPGWGEFFSPDDLPPPVPSGKGELSKDQSDKFFALFRHMQAIKLPTLSPLLPLLFRGADGKPFSLENHYQFEPFFNRTMPLKRCLITGRQLGKSTAAAVQTVLECFLQPNHKVLHVTPLYEQVRRFSTNYVRNFVVDSPFRALMIGPNTEKSVLQRSFLNRSVMYFTFASLDVSRARGIPSDVVEFDETNDIHIDFLPIIEECLSASPWGLVQYKGTPKTAEQTLAGIWASSSQAEWFIPCRRCKKENIPSLEYHLDAMIGDWREDISEQNPGTVCAFCGKVIHPRDGYWMHRRGQLAESFPGYHIPQPIMSMHYSKPQKWAQLRAKRAGLGGYTPAKYTNEVLGEVSGQGAQLISISELKAAATLPYRNSPRDPSRAVAEAPGYQLRALGVDWGGGGKEWISLTTLAFLGYRGNGRIDVLWGKRLLTPFDHLAEADECHSHFERFRCNFLAHDYTGAGSLRETFLRHKGVSLNKLVPVAYVGSPAGIPFRFVKATATHPRAHYQADKARVLLTVLSAIKLGLVRFFRYDWASKDDPGLIHDFLALTDNKIDRAAGSSIYTIQRNPLLSDDFAQAVTIGCCGLWQTAGAWPDIDLTRSLLKTAEDLPDDLEQADPGEGDEPFLAGE